MHFRVDLSLVDLFHVTLFQVILSLASHLYFDHPQEPDPEERGNYWAARYVDTQKVFKYRPDNVYDNIDVDWFGHPLTRDVACSTSVNCVPLKNPENIIGKLNGDLLLVLIIKSCCMTWKKFCCNWPQQFNF